MKVYQKPEPDQGQRKNWSKKAINQREMSKERSLRAQVMKMTSQQQMKKN